MFFLVTVITIMVISAFTLLHAEFTFPDMLNLMKLSSHIPIMSFMVHLLIQTWLSFRCRILGLLMSPFLRFLQVQHRTLIQVLSPNMTYMHPHWPFNQAGPPFMQNQSPLPPPILLPLMLMFHHLLSPSPLSTPFRLVLNMVFSSPRYEIILLLSTCFLLPSQLCWTDMEPTCYTQTSRSPHWQQAMVEEFNSLIKQALGLWFHLHPKSTQLDVNRFSKSNVILMVVLIIIKHI